MSDKKDLKCADTFIVSKDDRQTAKVHKSLEENRDPTRVFMEQLF